MNFTRRYAYFTPLFSSSLEWSWSSSDEGIRYYRYKASNEDEWTVVDSSITSLKTEDTVSSLELQASYDGILWSESSIGTYTKDIGLVLVSWTNKNDYAYIRYQRDSESEEGWTIIDGSRESIVLPYHKGINTYYIQSSWNGVLWSESAQCIFLSEEENKTPCLCNNLLWSWENEDEDVTAFRYQLNGGKWNILDGSVTSVKLPAVDGENTLLVASTYDEENWSESGKGTYFYIPRPYYPKKFELSLRLMPYTLQRIAYSEGHTPSSRLSGYSNGAGLSFAYNFDSIFSFCSDISAEYYSFENFHTYHDFKAEVKTRVRLFETEHYRNRLYLSFGFGLDAVLRNDSSAGCYPLLVCGIENSFMLSEKISLSLSCDFNCTFQDGTTVFHVVPSLSFTYHWGCKAGCTGCEGGCR